MAGSGGSVAFAWDEHRRVLRLKFPPGETLTGETADAVVREAERRRGAPTAYVGILADLSRSPDATFEYRRRVGEHFRGRRATTRIAIYDAPPVFRVMARMFATVTGVPIRAFTNEASALAWLAAPEAVA